MYAAYWGLAESPFAGPDEEFWFHAGAVHEEALARLCYLAEEPPRCGLLAGPAGTGKSLLLDILRRRRGTAGRHALRLDAAGRDGYSIAWELAAGLGLGPADGVAEHALWRNIGDHLDGLRIARLPVLLLFDDLDRADTGGQRAIERLLAESRGVDQLSTVLAARSDGVRRLSPALVDRCDLRIELSPLDEEETARFVLDLLSRAGAARQPFDSHALAAIHERTDGIPRRIRRLCDLSLLAGMSESLDAIDAEVVYAAADELAGRSLDSLRPAAPSRQQAWVR
ncbi:MAG: AAA family ATPase [Planctomycetaceae bacterium]